MNAPLCDYGSCEVAASFVVVRPFAAPSPRNACEVRCACIGHVDQMRSGDGVVASLRMVDVALTGPDVFGVVALVSEYDALRAGGAS